MAVEGGGDAVTVDIAELRRLLATATPGPWWLSASRVAVISADSVLVCSVNRITPQTDLELIAAAVNALPQLLDEVEAHRKVAAELNAFIAQRDQLMAIAEAAMLWRHGMVEVVDSDDGSVDMQQEPARNALIAAVDEPARKERT